MAAPAAPTASTPAAAPAPAAANPPAAPAAGIESEKPADAPAQDANATAPKAVEGNESTISGDEASSYLTGNLDALAQHLPAELQTPFRQNVSALCESYAAKCIAAQVVASTAADAVAVESEAPAADATASEAPAAPAGEAPPVIPEPPAEALPTPAENAPATSPAAPAAEAPAAPAAPPATPPAAPVAGTVTGTEQGEPQNTGEPVIRLSTVQAFESAGVPLTSDNALTYQEAGSDRARAQLLAGWKALSGAGGGPKPTPANRTPARSAPPKPAVAAAESAVPGTAPAPQLKSAREAVAAFQRP